MRYIIGIAAVAVYLASQGAWIADRVSTNHVRAPAKSAQQPVRSRPARMSIDSDRRGHFQVAATVDGRSIPFVVDTGASLVTLRETDAARLGIHPTVNDYTAKVSTANGVIKAAPARLRRVSVGDIEVTDVRALVLPDNVLAQNLLGVSFLSQLKRYEYANGRMVLEQ